MTIRGADRASLDAWVAMRDRLWPGGEADELREEALAYLEGRYPVLELALIAEDDAGRAIGFIELGVRAFSDGCTSSPVPHLEGWYVEPEYRRRGVAAALLGACERWARDRGYTEMASDALTENGVARTTHGALGFEEVETLVKFRKPLT